MPSITTVHLVSANNVCQKQINLNWTPYQGWNTDKYYIYRSLNGSSFELIDSTPSLKYTNLNAINGALYCFYIRAKKEFSSITSTSNITCTTFPNPISASNTHIKGVSVIDDNTIEIKWYTEDTERTIDASLYRAQGSNSPVFIKKIPFQNGINRILDPVPTDKTGYSYRIILNDSCPVNNDSSGISQSVFLSRDQTELQWTSYVFERSTNNGDHIFASSSTWNSLGITNQMGQSTWIVPEDSAFCYRVISISIDGDSSISNTVCIEDDLRVYIPTAIKLNGLSDNKYFGIFGTGIDWEKSSIGIFTRWGELIFQLQKSQQTWDGTYQQKPVQAGIYMYTGIIIGVKGDRIPVKGTILIIN